MTVSQQLMVLYLAILGSIGTAGVPSASIYVRAELLAPDGRAGRTATCDPLIGSQTTVCRDDLAMESLSSPIFIR